MSGCVPGRIEVKHAVPEELAAQIAAWAQCFLPPDRRCAGVQRVTSLYLDSPELTFYRWHRERQRDRFKLRIRTYGDLLGHSVFVEVKHRRGPLVRKSRAAWPTSCLSSIFSYPGEHPTVVKGVNPAAEEFVALTRAFSARPTLVVTSLREARRESGVGGETAVTIDRHIAYRTVNALDFEPAASGWRYVRLPPRPGASAIVELKHPGDLTPAWMAALLQRIAPYRVSFSKYFAALRQHRTWSYW